MRCVTEAAMVRASAGAWSRRGSYPVATASSMPVSRYPSRRSVRRTRWLIFWRSLAVRIAGRLALDKPGLEARLGAIEVDALKEDDMKMYIQINAATESLYKCNRSRLYLLPLYTVFDRLVDVILSDCGADDSMNLRRQVSR